MEDTAIRILDVVTEYSDLGDLNGENREDIIGWITEILESESYTKEQVNKIIKEKEKELKTRYNKAVFNLTDSLKEKDEMLDWVDKQLDKMANQIEKKDYIIRELSELLVNLSNEEEY